MEIKEELIQKALSIFNDISPSTSSDLFYACYGIVRQRSEIFECITITEQLILANIIYTLVLLDREDAT